MAKLNQKIQVNVKKFGLENVNNLEDLRVHLDSFEKGFQVNGVAFWYFLRSEVDTLNPLMNRKPTIPYEDYVKVVVDRLKSELFKLNKINGAVITAPDVVYGQIISVLQREVIKPWYEKTGGAKITKIDPKGTHRVEMIEQAYFEDVKKGNKVLGSGRMIKTISEETSPLGSRIKFISPDKLELVILYLSTHRKIVARKRATSDAGDIKSVEVEFGGSVSGTTLKELKQGFYTYAKSSHNKEYWTEVAKLVEINL